MSSYGKRDRDDGVNADTHSVYWAETDGPMPPGIASPHVAKFTKLEVDEGHRLIGVCFAVPQTWKDARDILWPSAAVGKVRFGQKKKQPQPTGEIKLTPFSVSVLTKRAYQEPGIYSEIQQQWEQCVILTNGIKNGQIARPLFWAPSQDLALTQL